MGWRHEIEGFQTLSLARWNGVPPDGALDRVNAVFVHAWDEQDPEEQKWFWVHHPGPFDTWATIDHDVDIAIRNYGLQPA